MKKAAFLFCISFFCSIELLLAQQAGILSADTAKTTVKRAQNVFVELGGAGLTFSANYDTRFSKKRDGLGGRIGAGYISADGNDVLSVPFSLNYLLGKGKNFFEVGVGATYLKLKTEGTTYTYTYNNGSGSTITREEKGDFLAFNESGILGTLNFGYRLQPIDSGFSFRASFNPLFGYGSFVPFAGLGFGYSF